MIFEVCKQFFFGPEKKRFMDTNADLPTLTVSP